MQDPVRVAELDPLQHLIRVALERRRRFANAKDSRHACDMHVEFARHACGVHISSTHLHVIVWYARWGALVHEFLEVKVQVLENEEELPLTVQDFDQTGFKKWAWPDCISSYILLAPGSYLTMLGWSSSISREISLIAVDGTPSHSLEKRKEISIFCIVSHINMRKGRLERCKMKNYTLNQKKWQFHVTNLVISAHSRVESNFLQRHTLPRVLDPGLVDNTVGALSNLLQTFELVHPVLQHRHLPCKDLRRSEQLQGMMWEKG